MGKNTKSRSKKLFGQSYRDYKMRRSTMKAKARSRMPISFLPTVHESKLLRKTKKITKGERRGQRPDTYLMEVRVLLEVLIKDNEKFNKEKLNRHILIADSVKDDIKDILSTMGRDIDEEDSFEFVEQLIILIEEMIDDYNSNNEGLRDEMYLLAKNIKKAIVRANKMYKGMKNDEALDGLLGRFSLMGVKS
jgi:vacuolar-type H+-ATPase subunit I/STV1